MSGRVTTRSDATVRVDRKRSASPAGSDRRPASRVWPLLVVAAVGLLFWTASRRVDCGPASGDALRGIVAAPRPTISGEKRGLRLGIFNIHGGQGRDEVRNLDRTADCIRGLDLVGLNEVHGAYFWQQADQAQLLGRKTGLAFLFAPSEQRWWHYRVGNAVLTSLELDHWQRIPLARQHGKGFRNLLLLRLQYDGLPLHVMITHVDRSDDRERTAQLRTLGELFLSLAEPAVLLGDLNTAAADPAMQRLLTSPGVSDPVAEILGGETPPRIDWILCRGLRCLDAGIVEHGASDHPLIWAQLELPAATSTQRGQME